MKGIEVKLTEGRGIRLDDFPHKDIPVLYELMRKEKFILFCGTEIISVDEIKGVTSIYAKYPRNEKTQDSTR